MKTSSANSFRYGVTMLELLVIIAVVSLLAALLLPAVVNAVEGGRQSLCKSRLKELGIALNNYHDAYKTFPPFMIRNGFSPQVRLLPFLGQDSLAAAVNSESFVMGPGGKGGFDSRSIQSTPASLICPSAGNPQNAANYRVNNGTETHPRENNGAFSVWKILRERDFSDGLGQTVFISERIAGDFNDATYTASRDLWLTFAATGLEGLGGAEYRTVYRVVGDVSVHASKLGGAWFRDGFENSAYNHILGPNSSTPDCGPRSTLPWQDWFNMGGAVAARSYHPGGVHTLFGDGSARFVSDKIEFGVWQSIATRAGGEGAVPNF